MKKLTLRIFILSLLFAFSGYSNAQVEEEIINWYNNTKPGMSIDKAYKLLKKIEPETVVVGIVDSGIDVDHEDLKGQIWINSDEIAGNGIDDDNNGYIDDIHGWNFLGKSDGTNLEHARLDGTRIYARLKPRFESIEDESEVAEEDKKDYELYLKTKSFVETNFLQYSMILQKMVEYRDELLPTLMPNLAKALDVKEEELTEEMVKEWTPKSNEEAELKRFGSIVLAGEDLSNLLNRQINQIQSMVDYYYNPDFDDRAVIGDDYLDMNDLENYGNNDYEGPDALHGTHVGGIVAALRGNGLGGDGVADNARLMSLRAVPDGDEFDKDIALSIRYAVDNGAKVINGSFGKAFSSLPHEVYEALIYAQEHDVLFVHAAGNDAKDLAKEDNFPAVHYEFQDEPFTHVLTIGASTRDDKGNLPAVFSNYGADQVDIFAPGFEIYNAIPDNKYQKLQGTSMAAPMVAGAVALIKGYFPNLTMLEIKNIILDSGDDYSKTLQRKPGTTEKVPFGELSRTGKVVNLHKAVKMAKKISKKKAKQNK
ncbi:MAG: S8 family serine peptidase [Brumimicrobium sp.]